jgi:cyclopropane fatty-acyl-phospholipid synthase-like methyltransferase
MSESKDLFAHKSKSWDMNSRRVKNAEAIAKLIVKNIKLKSDMEIMDFGAGTGLLSFFVSQKVGKVVAVDNSPSMLDEFRKKSSEFASQTEVLKLDLSTQSTDRKFDGIISSMTIHHLEDTKALFSIFYKMLHDGGFIAIADLDIEDGTFHSDNTGVFHHGFDREGLANIAKEVGFKNIHFETASIIKKPYADFSVFLMTAVK